jgi:uncharacterized protein
MMKRLIGQVLIYVVMGYRVTVGWMLTGHCRFEPTCSQYMIDAIRKYGPWVGLWRGVKRLMRCHPLGGSGYDPA